MRKRTPLPIDFNKYRKSRRYIVANRTYAVIYREGRLGKFVFVERLSNENGKTMEIDLVSDRPGRAISSGGAGKIHHGLEKKTTHHEEDAKRFAARIARFLKQSHAEDRYDELVLVAEPHFLGLLRAALPPSIEKLVKLQIPREYAQGSDQDLRRLIMRAANRAQEAASPPTELSA